ncbi:MAG: hypothetical protein L0216_16835 [Planctomycetales bacterium]|nr:hypothetical protein [Planctomycetales bacterium]
MIPKASGQWVAVCLDYYIVAQGGDLPELFSAFAYHWNGHVSMALQKGERPLDKLPPAPEEYENLYARGLDLFDHPLPQPPFGVKILPSPVVGDSRDLRFHWKQALVPAA